MNPRLPLRLAGVLFLLGFPFLSYCCDTWGTVGQVQPPTGNCSPTIFFNYVECNSNAVYYVQYSTDAANFYTIGSVAANGSGSYTYKDNYAHPQSSGSATVYYRVVYYIPSSGFTNYSPVFSVGLGSATCGNNNVTRCNGLPGFSIQLPSTYGICAGSSLTYSVSGGGGLPYPVGWSVSPNSSDVTLTPTFTSPYSVTVKNSSNADYAYIKLYASEEGCDPDSTPLIPLGIAPGPTSMNLPYGTTVHAGSDYDIYSATTNNWSVTNGTILYGQGTDDLGVQVADLQSGTMTVIATVVDACGTSPELIYNYPITSTGGGGGGTRFSPDSLAALNAGFGSGIKLGVYPNPATNSVQVVIASTDYTKSFIKLYDLNGRLLKTIIPGGQTTLVDLTQQSQGIYIMEIYDGRQRTIQKVVRL